MSGLTDIPTFMSLTYVGYREYAEVIGRYLLENQQSKLAPVGLAYLLIWRKKSKYAGKANRYGRDTFNTQMVILQNHFQMHEG